MHTAKYVGGGRLARYGRPIAENETRRAGSEAVQLTLTVLGTGLVACLVVGLIIGLVSDDVAGSLGRTVAIGMSITAVFCVAMILIPRRR